MKSDLDTQIDQMEWEAAELKEKIAELRRQRPREEVTDYRFEDWEGRSVRLSELFGTNERLILVHNMGQECNYCTMWADGFNGLTLHLSSQASFVVTSPNSPDAQKKLATSRGWQFQMLSADDRFIDEMGFMDPDEGLMPGVSVFVRDNDGSVYRVGRAEFGPGDDFCAVWSFLDLFPKGADGWEPRQSYRDTPVVAQCCNANENKAPLSN